MGKSKTSVELREQRRIIISDLNLGMIRPRTGRRLLKQLEKQIHIREDLETRLLGVNEKRNRFWEDEQNEKI